MSETTADVTVPEDLRTGVYANAFRVVEDGEDLFLDFVCYSARAQAGKVVGRIRIKPELMELVRNRIDQAI